MDNDQVIELYTEEFILNVVNEYLINTFDLYDGQLIDGLSFTMYNVEVIYEERKYYTITLFVVISLLGILVSKKIIPSYTLENRDLVYWNEKLYLLIKENVINIEKLEREVSRSIENNFNEIVNFISDFRNDTNYS
jgi:hypothetical protein